MICYEASKGGEYSSQFADQGRKDILVLAQIRVVPSAEKRSSKLLSIVKTCADRMSQRQFPNSRGTVEPVDIALMSIIPFLWVIHPCHNPIKDRLSGAFHAAAILVIAGFDRFETFKQKLLLYTKLLSMNPCWIEPMRAYLSP